MLESADGPIVRDRENTKGFVREEKRAGRNPLDSESSPLELLPVTGPPTFGVAVLELPTVPRPFFGARCSLRRV